MAGVLLGSVLGALLFLKCINDITSVIYMIRLFADKTSLFIAVDDHDVAADMINSVKQNHNMMFSK